MPKHPFEGMLLLDFATWNAAPQGASLVAERRALGPSERLEEALFTGLRLASGVDIVSVGRTYGADVWARFGDRLRPYIDAGLLCVEGPRLRLTREGMLIANEIMAVFV
jgi:oxygen-independent coproporphyrinogen-3 oxidase